MTILTFDSTPNDTSGAMLFHSEADWSVQWRENGRLEGAIETDENQGSWWTLDTQSQQWGAIVRRGDTPYNDCLPPSEVLLKDSFREADTPEQRIEWMQSEADRGFYNPFNAVVGTLAGDQTLLLEQSFQASSKKLEPGFHVLVDGEPPDGPETTDYQTLSDVPGTNELDELVHRQGSPDGLREPAMGITWSVNGDSVSVAYRTMDSSAEWSTRQHPLE